MSESRMNPSVTITEIERDDCHFCTRPKKVTHRVVINHPFKWLTVNGELEACEQHAKEIVQEWEAQIRREHP